MESGDGNNSQAETTDAERCSRHFPKYPIIGVGSKCCKPKKMHIAGTTVCCRTFENKEEKCENICEMKFGVSDEGKPLTKKWSFFLSQQTSLNINGPNASGRWLKGQCQEFQFGYGGNQNNFNTRAECEKACPSQRSPGN